MIILLQSNLDTYIGMNILIWIVFVYINKKDQIFKFILILSIVMSMYSLEYAPIKLLFNVLKKILSFYWRNLFNISKKEKEF